MVNNFFFQFSYFLNSFPKGLESRSLLNVNTSQPYSATSSEFDNGFIRDTGTGLVYQGCSPANGFITTIQLPAPINQPKSDYEDFATTGYGYAALKRLLQGVVNVEIIDLNDSDDLIYAEFQDYDGVIAGCNVCSQLENRRKATYIGGDSKLYEPYVYVNDIFNVEGCEIF